MKETKGKLLIVEDAPDLQLLLRKLFENEGYEVFCASNGAEALRALSSMASLPSLILLDLEMPVLDGAGFLAKQRELPIISTIPVLVLSAESGAQVAAKGIHAKACLRKPLDILELVTAVRRYTSVADDN